MKKQLRFLWKLLFWYALRYGNELEASPAHLVTNAQTSGGYSCIIEH